MKLTFLRFGAVFSSLALAGAYIGVQTRHEPAPLARNISSTEGVYDLVAKPPKPKPQPQPARVIPVKLRDEWVMPSSKTGMMHFNNVLEELESNSESPFHRDARYKPPETRMDASRD